MMSNFQVYCDLGWGDRAAFDLSLAVKACFLLVNIELEGEETDWLSSTDVFFNGYMVYGQKVAGRKNLELVANRIHP